MHEVLQYELKKKKKIFKKKKIGSFPSFRVQSVMFMNLRVLV